MHGVILLVSVLELIGKRIAVNKASFPTRLSPVNFFFSFLMWEMSFILVKKTSSYYNLETFTTNGVYILSSSLVAGSRTS